MQRQDDFQVKAEEYKTFLDKRLRSDLQRVTHRRTLTVEEQKDYKALQLNINLLLQNKQRSFRSLLHLEEGVHLKAEVPDTNFIYIKIGLGFHAQCTLPEALALTEVKMKELQHTLDSHDTELGRLKAHMTLMALGLQALESE